MGNILTQKRNGGGTSATALDDLTYNYHTTTDGLVSNRLYQVNDVVSAGNYTDDIDDQGTFNNTHSTIETANNYGYDELGNLVRDVQEEIASIEWTIYGKMKKITRNSGSSKADLEFGYDASGNRLWKKVTPKGSGALVLTYYYLRDAQGNEMCRYVKYTNTSSQLMYVAQEHSIYGSSRVGVDGRKDTLYKAGSYSPAWGGANTSRRALGLKSFELANHLGNVLVTVSDKPVYKISSGVVYFNPEITSISDYYPFGAPIAGRGYSSEAYRFGYNTQEKTDEISGPGNHNTATFWEYDTRLGRRWNQDPVVKPGQSSYACLNNSPIRILDPNGDDGYVDEDGNYLGDDGDKKNHNTRVINKSTYESTLGKNEDGTLKSVTDESRKLLQTNITTDDKGVTTGTSKLLQEYEKGISISDATWKTLTTTGGTRLLPFVENNTSQTVFYKPEGMNADKTKNLNPYASNSGAYPIAPGKDLYSPVDGVNSTTIDPQKVYKVLSDYRVVIDNSGPDIINFPESTTPYIPVLKTYGEVDAPDKSWYALRDCFNHLQSRRPKK